MVTSSGVEISSDCEVGSIKRGSGGEIFFGLAPGTDGGGAI